MAKHFRSLSSLDSARNSLGDEVAKEIRFWTSVGSMLAILGFFLVIAGAVISFLGR